CATTQKQTQTTVSNAAAFNLEGQIEGLESSEVFLRYRDPSGERVTESGTVENGSFSITGEVAYPTPARLYTKDRSINTMIYLERGDLNIQGSVDDLNITGSKTQNEAEALEKATADLSEKRVNLVKEYRAAAKKK